MGGHDCRHIRFNRLLKRHKINLPDSGRRPADHRQLQMGIKLCRPKSGKVLGAGSDPAGLQISDHQAPQAAHRLRIVPQRSFFHEKPLAGGTDIQHRGQIHIDPGPGQFRGAGGGVIDKRASRVGGCGKLPRIGKLRKRQRQTCHRAPFLINGNQRDRQVMSGARLFQINAQSPQLARALHVAPEHDKVIDAQLGNQPQGGFVNLPAGDARHDKLAKLRKLSHYRFHL